MPYYVKKPIVVFAEEIKEPIEVRTLEGTMRGNPGDMLITGVKGEKYPCQKDIFEATYELAPDSISSAVAGVDPLDGRRMKRRN